MKLKDLEKKLRDLGFKDIGGGKHTKWSDGKVTIPVPRHKEINEFTARGIIKTAEEAARARESK